ncbi:hypothetical protein ElyMa_003773900 [Elysia marginata]|uniref:Uncharacterized protein n=1 Tax=Elysia marginata TaxID=1093978 RepID=A0AAV4FAV1_9GAST|nr:hypothetical protein ElyMa_003773900 [Elysia marginata]
MLSHVPLKPIIIISYFRVEVTQHHEDIMLWDCGTYSNKVPWEASDRVGSKASFRVCLLVLIEGISAWDVGTLPGT